MSQQPGGPTPLRRYVRVQALTDTELRNALREAADEAERIIVRMGSPAGLGGQIEKARLQMMVKQLRNHQASLYKTVNSAVRAGMRRAATAAAEAELSYDRLLFRAARESMDAWGKTVLGQALDNVPTLEARAFNGISLSQQVYKTEALSRGLVDRAVNNGILLGRSAKQIAADVRHLISPSTPGGVSYASMRLGRTELNNAFHRTQIDLRADNPWTEGMQWHLSGSHPKPDACNEYADQSHFKGGEPGVFRPNEVPDKPHPQCLCFLTTEVVGEDQFIDSLLGGEYDEFLSRPSRSRSA